MGLITEEVEVGVGCRNNAWYENKGYILPKRKNKRGMLTVPMGTKINVSVKDLPDSSGVLVKVKCDECKDEYDIRWTDYKKSIKKHEKKYCRLCSFKLYGAENSRLTALKNGTSFGQYLINTYGKNAINLYWSNKNNSDPFNISHMSNKKVWINCTLCKNEKLLQCSTFHQRGLSCPKCGDGFSYPNKIGYNILTQFKKIIKNVITEYSPMWAKGYKYDFYFELDKNKYIVEMDGGFHNKDNTMSGQTKEESKEIDNYKNQLAKEHGIEVIRIDCEKSELEYIKNKTENSRLEELLDLSIIDWKKCNKYACSSLVSMASDMWINGNKNVINISNKLNITKTTTRKYLKQGAKLGLCNYDPDIEQKKSKINTSKKVYCLELSEVFTSINQAEIRLKIRHISECCKNKPKHKTAGGYHWMYYKDWLKLHNETNEIK